MLVLAFAASLRKDSLNRKLINVASELARRQGAQVDLAEFREFNMPLYDGDLEAQGLPPGARELKERVENADALMIASPEYNYSLPGTLKNAIDWVSRCRPVPFRGKSVFLLAASSGQVGGIRGLWQLRIPLEGLGSLVFPDMFALPNAQRMFDAEGNLADAQYTGTLDRMVTGFVRLAEAVMPVTGHGRTNRTIARALEEQSGLQPRPQPPIR